MKNAENTMKESDEYIKLIETLETLLEEMEAEEEPEKKLKLAQTYKVLKEVLNEDWNTTLSLEMEDKKSWRSFWGTVIAALCGSALMGGIRAMSNRSYQIRAIQAEQDDIIVKPQKMLPPFK